MLQLRRYDQGCQHSTAGNGKAGEVSGHGAKVLEASGPVVKGGTKRRKRQAKNRKKKQ